MTTRRAAYFECPTPTCRGDTRIVYSRLVAGMRVRHRECRRCGDRFRTRTPPEAFAGYEHRPRHPIRTDRDVDSYTSEHPPSARARIVKA